MNEEFIKAILSLSNTSIIYNPKDIDPFFEERLIKLIQDQWVFQYSYFSQLPTSCICGKITDPCRVYFNTLNYTQINLCAKCVSIYKFKNKRDSSYILALNNLLPDVEIQLLKEISKIERLSLDQVNKMNTINNCLISRRF